MDWKNRSATKRRRLAKPCFASGVVSVVPTGRETQKGPFLAAVGLEGRAVLVGSETFIASSEFATMSENHVISTSSETPGGTSTRPSSRRTMSFGSIPKPLDPISIHGLAFYSGTARKNRLRASTTLRIAASYKSPRASIPAPAAVLNHILPRRGVVGRLSYAGGRFRIRRFHC